jgi:hypothetical protein
MQRAGAIVVARVQMHQTAKEILAEWIESEQALGQADGRDDIALRFQVLEELFKDLPVLSAEPLPFR